MNIKLIDAIKSLKSVTKYSEKKVDWRMIIRAIDAARYAPCAHGITSTRFILVSDPEKIEKLGPATQQEFVMDVDYVVIAVTNDSNLVRNYGERGHRYASQQAGAEIENFLLALTGFGYVTKWVQFFYDDKVKDIFGIPYDHHVEGIFPIGKPHRYIDKQEKKTDLENFLYFDKWKNKKMRPQPIIRTTSYTYEKPER